MTYNQCEMIRGTTVQVAWVPSKFAKPLTYVKLKNAQGHWTNGWLITWVSKIALSEEGRRKAGEHDVFASIS